MTIPTYHAQARKRDASEKLKESRSERNKLQAEREKTLPQINEKEESIRQHDEDIARVRQQMKHERAGASLAPCLCPSHLSEIIGIIESSSLFCRFLKISADGLGSATFWNAKRSSCKHRRYGFLR